MGMGVLGWVHLGKNLAGLFLSPAAIFLLSNILIASKKKTLSAFRFRVIPSLSLTSCGFKEKGSSETLASIPHCTFSSSRVKSPSFYCFQGIKLIFLS